MSIVLRKGFLGLECDIKFVDGIARETVCDESSDVIYDGEYCAAYEYFKVLKLDKLLVSLAIPSEWKRAWNTVCKTGDQPSWKRFVGKNLFDKWLYQVSRECDRSQRAINDHIEYYFKCLKRCKKFVDALQKSKIDVDYFNSIKDLSEVSVGSFAPDETGFSKKPIYTLSSTITGRVKIADGPNILNLHKKNRQLLTTRFEGGKILYCDFRQLETRVLMSHLAKKPELPNDIYTDISRKSNMNLDRDVAKRIVISLMFGMHTNTIKKELNLSASDAIAMVDSVKKYIGLRECEKWIKANRVDWKQKKLFNAFGRPIDVSEKNAPIVNYYIQSTAVEFSLMTFSKLINKFDREFVIPTFVLHDALILDVAKNSINDVKNEFEKGIVWNGMHFPLSVEVI